MRIKRATHILPSNRFFVRIDPPSNRKQAERGTSRTGYEPNGVRAEGGNPRPSFNLLCSVKICSSVPRSARTPFGLLSIRRRVDSNKKIDSKGGRELRVFVCCLSWEVALRTCHFHPSLSSVLSRDGTRLRNSSGCREPLMEIHRWFHCFTVCIVVPHDFSTAAKIYDTSCSQK